MHWLAAPILLGLLVRRPGGGRPTRPAPSVAFGDADSLLAGLDRRPGADEVFAVSLLSMARPDTPPPGATTTRSSVRPMPDSLGRRCRPRPARTMPALDGLSRAELAAAAPQAAAELGLAPGGRLLWSAP